MHRHETPWQERQRHEKAQDEAIRIQKNHTHEAGQSGTPEDEAKQDAVSADLEKRVKSLESAPVSTDVEARLTKLEAKVEAQTHDGSVKGEKGDKGDKGDHGDQGEKGDKGDAGIGVQGEKGEIGNSGLDGVNGTNGTNGVDGAVGQPGEAIVGQPGLDGKDGTVGRDGLQGDRGERGEVGEQGKTGPPFDDTVVKQDHENMKAEVVASEARIEALYAISEKHVTALNTRIDELTVASGPVIISPTEPLKPIIEVA